MDAEFNNYALPPGTFVQEELEEREWSQSDLAYILGIPPQSVNQLITGKKGISADMAKALGEAFGTSAEVWANLQKAYDLAKAREPDPAIAKRGLVQSEYPLREMVKRGWLQATESADILELQFARFFDVPDFAAVPHLDHAAKRTRYDDVPPAQLAWLFRVRQIAKEMIVPEFSKEKLESAIERMKQFRESAEEIRHVPTLLQDAGVRFVIVECLPNSKIDGVCFWLDDSAPVIGLSLRYDRIDNFWFVLAHEATHVLCGHGKSSEIIDVELGEIDAISDEENIANNNAADFCVDQSKMDSFFHRKTPYFYERDVLAFALRMNVHPGIVVGQLQKRMQRYDYLRKHQVKIRDYLSISAIVDGWGYTVPVDL